MPVVVGQGAIVGGGVGADGVRGWEARRAASELFWRDSSILSDRVITLAVASELRIPRLNCFWTDNMRLILPLLGPCCN